MKKTEVNIDYSYCEPLRLFPEQNPLPNLEWARHTPDELNANFNLENITFINDPRGGQFSMENYPESYDQAKARV